MNTGSVETGEQENDQQSHQLQQPRRSSFPTTTTYKPIEYEQGDLVVAEKEEEGGVKDPKPMEDPSEEDRDDANQKRPSEDVTAITTSKTTQKATTTELEMMVDVKDDVNDDVEDVVPREENCITEPDPNGMKEVEKEVVCEAAVVKTTEDEFRVIGFASDVHDDDDEKSEVSVARDEKVQKTKQDLNTSSIDKLEASCVSVELKKTTAGGILPKERRTKNQSIVHVQQQESLTTILPKIELNKTPPITKPIIKPLELPHEFMIAKQKLKHHPEDLKNKKEKQDGTEETSLSSILPKVQLNKVGPPTPSKTKKTEQQTELPEEFEIVKQQLKRRIKGPWLGRTDDGEDGIVMTIPSSTTNSRNIEKATITDSGKIVSSSNDGKTNRRVTFTSTVKQANTTTTQAKNNRRNSLVWIWIPLFLAIGSLVLLTIFKSETIRTSFVSQVDQPQVQAAHHQQPTMSSPKKKGVVDTKPLENIVTRLFDPAAGSGLAEDSVEHGRSKKPSKAEEKSSSCTNCKDQHQHKSPPKWITAIKKLLPKKKNPNRNHATTLS